MPLDPERALQKALITHLRADAGLTALLTHPSAIHDQPPEDVGWPHLLIGRSESRPIPADGTATEHILTLTVRSRFGGTEEAKAICAAVRAALDGAAVEADGVRTVSLAVTFSDVFRTSDTRRTWGVMRVRAVTEESGA